MNKTSNIYLLAAGLLLLTACGSKQEVADFEEPLPEKVDFNYHVKPILSDTCYLCHGPDLPNNKAGLSLSSFASATQHMTDAGQVAIQPGSADDSEAFLRIISDDENFMMPPPSSNLTLTARDKAMIKKWIDQGAEYKKHWALIRPDTPKVPETQNQNWANSPIDQFVLKTLEDNQLTPQSSADKETLIRRVSFDLTGLPPTLEEIDKFIANDSGNAYQVMVERMMSKPAYGERLATEWLDVARFADTHGYSTDFYRDMSPYRDWVINAFNRNQRFDEFVQWQVAGDLYPNPSTEQMIATAFNRVHAQNGEGGIVNEEFRVEYVKDRVQTIGTGLLGLTMHCAQCHDHKYDPISTKDYYSTYAFFNSFDESGQISYDADDMPVPTLLLPSEQEKQQLAEISQQLDIYSRNLSSKFGFDNSEFQSWFNNFSKAEVQIDKTALIAHFPLGKQDSNEQIANLVSPAQTGKVIFGSDPKKKEGEDMLHVTDEGRDAIKINGDDPLYFPDLNDFDRASQFTVSIDANIPESITDGVLVHFNKAGILYNFKGFDVSIEDNHWLVRFAHTYPYNAIVLTSKQPVARNQWQTVTLTYDGSSQAEGVGFYLNGQPIKMQIERDNLYKEIRHNKDGVLKEIGLKVGARWRSRGLPDTLVDNLMVFDRDLTGLEVAAMSGLEVNSTDREQWLALYNKRFNVDYRKAQTTLTEKRREYNGLAEQIQEIMVSKEKQEPRQAYVLLRGSYASHGEPVQPGVPENILPFDSSWPRDRRGLANWLTHPDHPLVPRVVVNRYWQMLFGQGLVSTPEDFGNQGKLPSHPDLLDWLARDFVDNGWNVKRLITQIVMSSTYQQSSKASQSLLEKDPQNVLLARGPASRLTAEMIRDNALATSGLLVDKVGGESVRPYQPDGIWRMNNMDYKRGEGEALYRRSMYTIYKRSTPPPNMMAFDAPSRSHSVGVRQETSTPLQALALLNDPQIVEASRVLAEKITLQTTQLDQQIAQLYRNLTSRKPSQQEAQIIADMYADITRRFEDEPEKAEAFLAVGESPVNQELDQIQLAALGSVANMLINHDASVIKR